MTTLRIDVLSFEDCPNREVAKERLRAALAEENLTADVIEIEVTDPTIAQELHFLGSPTIRINDVDVEPSARAAVQFGLMCRTYKTLDGFEGAPPFEMIRAALRAQHAGNVSSARRPSARAPVSSLE